MSATSTIAIEVRDTATPTVAAVLLRQIGAGNVLAISGGRIVTTDDGAILPVRYGYTVEVELDRAADTYTVRRVFTRAGRRTVKGAVAGVYCDQVGETAYRASCFRDPFGGAA